MRSLAYFKKGDIHFTDSIPSPKINHDHELIIDVSWCGICGTDLHEYLEGPIFMPPDGETHYLSGLELPLPMGHEMSGIVKEVGKGVTKVKPGDRVVIEATTSCGDTDRWDHSKVKKGDKCSACSMGLPNCCTHGSFQGLGSVGGGFAEQVVVGEKHVVPIPDKLPLDVAALVEPLSVAWHAARLAEFKEGSTALVLGSGPIGLAMILCLKGMKAGKVIVSEPAKLRRELAEKLNVTVFNPSHNRGGDSAIEELKSYTKDNKGFDYTFDCSGVQDTFNAAIKTAGIQGHVVNVAIWGPKPVAFHPMDMTYGEKKLTGTMGYVTRDFEEVVDAIDKGDISIEECKTLITGRVKLEEGMEKGFHELIDHKEGNVKVLLTPNNHGELP
ncbi:hypothetical protein RNJ44_02585 [Nakaseomyces bracarensis]|uniref:Uncharacterized protein n=1 Tax=Nakaseomyces bracarensis TaxID=273131 RepID=A0ABR4NM69_9SACH